jgi:hypothetical protein
MIHTIGSGPLRRKYDGVKYALKKLEDILFELSVTEPERQDVCVPVDVRARRPCILLRGAMN